MAFAVAPVALPDRVLWSYPYWAGEVGRLTSRYPGRRVSDSLGVGFRLVRTLSRVAPRLGSAHVLFGLWGKRRPDR